MNVSTIIGVVLAAMNFWAVMQFWLDKRAARAGRHRIPEVNLLWTAVIGGTPGVLLARHLFRHKTRKQPFSAYLYAIFGVQIGLIIGLLIWPPL